MKPPLVSGEEIIFRNPAAWMTCCDCGLTHALIITANGDGEPSVCVYRDVKETELTRSKRKAMFKRKLEKILEGL